MPDSATMQGFDARLREARMIPNEKDRMMQIYLIGLQMIDASEFDMALSLARTFSDKARVRWLT